MLNKRSVSFIITILAVLFSFNANAAIIANPLSLLVTNNQDSGNGSLRQAIISANFTLGHNTIKFDIPGVGPHTIQPQSALPVITSPVSINGYSEPGARLATNTETAHLKIVLDGTLAGVAVNGLELETSDSQVKGLVVKNFSGDGITITGDSNLIRGCYIGTNKIGSDSRPNGFAGINILGDYNEIGGTMIGHRNLISANLTSGVMLWGDNNLIHGNTIGLDISTTIGLGNGESGIAIYGTNNIVGGTDDGSTNVISGNKDGVLIAQGTGNQLLGNIIGTDQAGSSSQLSLGNGTGVVVGGTGGNEIGGTATNSGNIISNNNGNGIDIFSDGNFIQGNIIGTNFDGTTALGNGVGIMLYGDNNLIGGLIPDAGNLISGNNSSGLLVRPPLGSSDKPELNLVQGNKIGTDTTGDYAIANGSNGIYLFDADTTIIGGLIEGSANVISGNNNNGILVESFTNNLGSYNNVIFGNNIGANSSRSQIIPNLASGIRVLGAEGTRIGGVLPNAGNFIHGNGADGVTIESGVNNGILGNSIEANSELGIDLLDDGVTNNDAIFLFPILLFDLDIGPHNLQNFPILEIATTDGSSTSVVVSLRSTPATEYRLEFFSSETCNPSGHGEAAVFLGAVNIITDPDGTRVNASFVLDVATSIGHSVVATASELSGPLAVNTSEFSECLTVI